MKVLLLGEYSRLHNTLKEGLTALGHEVVLVGDGDGFKNFPVDISIRPTWGDKSILKWVKLGLYKVFKLDILALERGLRFWIKMPALNGFDVVQLINEKPIKTLPAFERFLLKKIFKNNQKTLLLSCGIDVISVEFMLQKKFKYSLMNPFFENPTLAKEYQYILDYTSASHRKTHDFVFSNIEGVIASDFDYVLPLEGHSKFLGLIPNPVNSDTIPFAPLNLQQKTIIFLGINRGTYHKKGIPLFEEALVQLQKKYSEKIDIRIAENIPYAEYLQQYNDAHIILDQVYSYDQGYNALEAMAKGKVVFTGAEEEFLSYYKLEKDTVCINALPEVSELVQKLSWLIENPEQLKTIGKNARAFIEKEHNYIEIAKKYEKAYRN